MEGLDPLTVAAGNQTIVIHAQPTRDGRGSTAILAREPHNVVFTEAAAGLDFDESQRDGAMIFEAVDDGVRVAGS